MTNEEKIKKYNEVIPELYNKVMEMPLKVLDIFNDFFGEAYVDMQGALSKEELKNWIFDLPQTDFEDVLTDFSDPSNLYKLKGLIIPNRLFILIHFPHVRITNEHDRYVDITHLWVKVEINDNGTINQFTFNRSEYPVVQFVSNYLHSHVDYIPTHDFTCFRTPCMGNGPIRTTIYSLNKSFDENLWQLFCLELSKFVTVESISGIPYHYLEKIGLDNYIKIEHEDFPCINSINTATSSWSLVFNREDLKDFIQYFIQGNHLRFNYINGTYSIGMSSVEFFVLISNEFITWFNEQYNTKEKTVLFEQLKNADIVTECCVNNGKIYSIKPRNYSLSANLNDYIGKKVCTFKGKDITLNITNIPEIEKNKSIMLNYKVSCFILQKILKVLNYRYGRNSAKSTETQVGTKVRYL